MAAALLLALAPDVAALLRDLGHDDIDVRHAAAAELHRRGEEVRPRLLDARREASDVELRARLDDLLRRLDVEERIGGFGGGNRVAGFGMSIRTDRFHGRGPIRLTVEVMNLASGRRTFPGMGAWDLETPEQETRTQGADARVSVRKVIGSGLRRVKWGFASADAAVPAALGPGESLRYEYVLDARSLPAGDYEVRVEYFRLEETLRSNSARLLVRQR